MRSEVRRELERSRRCLPHMREVIGRHLVLEASPEEDRRHNTDLIVLELAAVRVACRVRDAGYLAAYGHQFTIRSRRPSGVDTELDKVITGWGTHILYGFAAEDTDRMTAWLLGDLDVFRLWHHRECERRRGARPGLELPNGDQSSWFCAYDVAELPETFVVARRRHVQPAALTPEELFA